MRRIILYMTMEICEDSKVYFSLSSVDGIVLSDNETTWLNIVFKKITGISKLTQCFTAEHIKDLIDRGFEIIITDTN